MNDVELFGGMMEVLETIAYLVTHCTHLERLYLPPGFRLSVGPELESTIIQLYAEILTLLVQAIQYIRQNTAGVQTAP